MVVMSAAVVTADKTLVARQFVEMTRLRVEGLLGAFHKLVDVGRDHTFIETETVRYVYQPMEALRLLLVTSKSSNILEDLETLRLFAKVVQDCCQTQVNEKAVLRHAFDIVNAVDEVISFGHRESVTLSQVKSFTEMDSHEENLQRMIEQSKINAARDKMQQKARQLKMTPRQGRDSSGQSIEGPDVSRSPPLGRGGGGGIDGNLGVTTGPGDSMGSGVSAPVELPVSWTPSRTSGSAATIEPKAGPKKGMALRKQKSSDPFASFDAADPAGAMVAAEEDVAAPVANPFLTPVKVVIQERITAEFGAEGCLNGEATCSGSFEAAVLDRATADLVCFKLAPQSQGFKYKVHPSLNKASHAADVLEVRQGQSAFPAGGCLRWQLKTKDEAFLPVSVSCWPTPTGEGTRMVLELELTDESSALENVMISFPAPASSRPTVSSASPGEARLDDGMVVWHIPLFDSSERRGTLEFSAAVDATSLLPATFGAMATGTTRCPMEILECYHQVSKDAIAFACDKKVVYELSIGV